MLAHTAEVTGFFHPYTCKHADTETLRMSGYASVFYVRDNHDDIVIPGAFADIAAPEEVKLLWQHQADTPIGVIRTLKEDAYGLFMEADILCSSRHGQEAAALLQGGALSGLSIGYRTIESDIDGDTGARLLKKAQLWEISIVTFPANTAANITRIGSGGTNAAPKSIRDIERVLRAGGCSRTESKRIAAHGFCGDTPLSLQEKNDISARIKELTECIKTCG